MTRVAVFVDAGYLYAAGATALTGSKQNRTHIALEQEKTIDKLKHTASEQAKDVPLLRIYWYDGQVGGQPSTEQRDLAKTDDIKVRLGFVTATGRQKGVDSLIVTDLIELARNHAISNAVLLSGDGDLRIAVQIAQSFGVRVHLIEIETNEGNQSNFLKQEADTTRKWDENDIQEILSVKSSHLDISQDSHNFDSDEDSENKLIQVATEVAEALDDNELTTVYEYISRYSSIPKEKDTELLKAGSDKLERWLEKPTETNTLRKQFKEAVRRREETDRQPNSS